MPSQIAAQMYTLREFLKTPADIATSMKRVREIGYEAVQLSGLGMIMPLELKRILDGEGLQAVITHVAFDRLWNDFDVLVDEHKLWNCPNVAIGSMPAEYRTGKDGYVSFAGIASEIAHKLKAHDLTFSYHNHSFEFAKLDGKTGLAWFYETADPLVQAEIDTYWVQHGGGDPADWCARMKHRMPVVHVKDMVILEGQQTMAEVGEGNLNWPRILDACRGAGVQWYAVEQDVCHRDPFESLAISLRNLKAMGLE
ncbi:MAG: sugar phosphate isomerase/epimerase family protein [Armatimonadota bacterium]